jgi:hypothetical protein
LERLPQGKGSEISTLKASISLLRLRLHNYVPRECLVLHSFPSLENTTEKCKQNALGKDASDSGYLKYQRTGTTVGTGARS